MLTGIFVNGQKSFVSVSPYPVNVYQPDGSRLIIYGVGDEFNHFSVTEDGFTVLKNEDGFYEFAHVGKFGNLNSSGFRARNIPERNDLDRLFLQSIPKYLSGESTSILPKYSVTEEVPQNAFPSEGTQKVLMLLIEYPDLESTYSESEFDGLMNESNYNGNGSFKDYYFQASDGDLSLNVDVFGWYVSQEDYFYYGDDNESDRARILVGEAVDAAEAAGVDFSIYDNDGDGEVDNLIIVHSGPGAEEGSRTEYIWSHSWSLSFRAREYDGVVINSYVIQPETRSYGMVGIGVFCHEFGHALGLPDLYDTDAGNGDSEGLGNWCLMAGGGWLNNERTPAMLSAWAREDLGWISPTVINAEGNYSLLPTGASTDCYKMLTPNSNEYFLLENRYKTGFDAYLPGSGLAIYHVNTSKLDHGDNDDENNKLADFEEADGDNDLDNEVNRGDAGDVFPGSSNNPNFSDITNPNAQTYDSKLTGIDIQNIVLDGSVIRFTLGVGLETGKDLTFNEASNALNIVNSTLDVDLQVKNEGTESAATFKVSFYLSTDQTIATSDYLVGEKTVSALAGGALKNLNLLQDASEVVPSIPSGNYFVGYIIDSGEAVDELDEENNSFVFTSELLNLVSLPNLAYNLPQNNFVINGFDVVVDLQVENRGSLISDPCKIGFFISVNNPVSISDYFIGEIVLESLNSEEVANKIFSVNVLDEIPGLPEGEYYVGYIIDYESAIDESNEMDNSYTSILEQVDNYFIPNLTFNPIQNNITINGYDVTLDMQVQNRGDLSSAGFKIGYFISQTKPVDLSGYYIGETDVASLNPNEEANKSFSVNVIQQIPDLPSGEYYVGYVIDYENDIAEEIESDNSFTFEPERVDNILTPNLTFNPNLNVLEITATDIVIELQVTNNGETISESCMVGYYLSTDNTITTSDFLMDDDYVRSLNVDGTSNEWVAIDIASLEGKISIGEYFVGYLIDFRGDVNELDEQDNDYVFSETVFQYCPPVSSVVDGSICEGDSVVINNSVIKIEGSYEFVFESQSGCDSIVTLNLTVFPANNTALNTVICSGDSVVIGDSVYKNSGIYTEVFTSQLGCDSTVTLNLEVLESIETVLDETICVGESVQIGEFSYSESGTFTNVFSTFFGCDSTVVLNLIVNPLSDTLITKTICGGDSILVGNSVFKESGIFTVMLNNRFGCDSLITIDLIVNPVYEININEVICAGDSVAIGQFIYTESGIFVNTFSSEFGCDSTVILDLTVNPVHDTLLEVVLCEGESIRIGNSVYSETGFFIENLTNQFGCDSIVSLDLTVNPVHETLLEMVLCEGKNIQVGNSVYSESGVFVEILTNQFGCDSIVTLVLTVNPVNETILNETICEGESVVVGSSEYNVSGNFIDVLNNRFGCDSTVYLNLTVNPVYEHFISVNICEGTSYSFAGMQLFESGVYEHNFASRFACDSLVILNLKVTSIQETILNETVCAGESVQVGDFFYSESGTFSNTFSTAFGCDSTVVLNLAVNPQSDTLVTKIICQGDSVEVGNLVFKESGIYTETLSNRYGCDSLVTLHLMVNPIQETLIYEIICEGDSVAIDQFIYTESGIFVNAFSNEFGCDSTVILDLTVNPVHDTLLEVVLCEGESFTVGNSVYSETGVFVENLTNQFGCDSTVTLVLTVNSVYKTLVDEIICDGDSIVIGSSVYRNSGVYTNVLNTRFGCDSTILLNLIVNPLSDTILTKTICQGDSILVGNSIFKESGIFTEMLNNRFGCDSVITIDLIVNPVHEININEVICAGDSVAIGQFTYTQSGIFVNTFSNEFGCDSTIILDLTVNPVHDTLLEVVLCQGESFAVGNSVYSETGIFVETLTNQFGCDSVVTLNLIINPVHEIMLEEIICDGDSVIIGTSVYKISGSYTDVLANEFGCDSTVYLNLTVNPINEVDVYENICEGTFYFIGDAQYANSGTYEHHFSNQYGCDSMVMLFLNVVPLPKVDLGDDFVMFSSETKIVDAGNFSYYLWNTGETEQSISINSSNGLGAKIFSVTATDEYMCSGSDEIEIIIYDDNNPAQDKEPLLKIFPNPNRGNLSLLIEQVSGRYEVLIFSESGTLVYRNEFISPGSKFVKSLNLEFLRSGNYTLQVVSNNKRMVEKLVIIRD